MATILQRLPVGENVGIAFSGGLAGMLLFQMIVNIGMVLGVMPITGLDNIMQTGERLLDAVGHQPRPHLQRA